MKKQFHTPTGIIERDLTVSEIEEFANKGDNEALKEKAKEELKTADTDNKKINAILRFLRLQ